MKPILTTITPYWDRPQMLEGWMRAVKGANVPEVQHLLISVGGDAPEVLRGIDLIHLDEEPGQSIGHYHNLGAAQCDTEWIMKIDVDVIPNVSYFKTLVAVLQKAEPREWFNGGMLYLDQAVSASMLAPLPEDSYYMVINHRHRYCVGYMKPGATNFICRRQEYLDLGGCHPGFYGWGWEDYQQIYMLEKFFKGTRPLSPPVTFENVTNKCRDEISRPRAQSLFWKSSLLCLLHRSHPSNKGTHMDQNKRVLFDYIKKDYE